MADNKQISAVSNRDDIRTHGQRSPQKKTSSTSTHNRETTPNKTIREHETPRTTSLRVDARLLPITSPLSPLPCYHHLRFPTPSPPPPLPPPPPPPLERPVVNVPSKTVARDSVRPSPARRLPLPPLPHAPAAAAAETSQRSIRNRNAEGKNHGRMAASRRRMSRSGPPASRCGRAHRQPRGSHRSAAPCHKHSNAKHEIVSASRTPPAHRPIE